jgi:hypothetical protein
MLRPERLGVLPGTFDVSTVCRFFANIGAAGIAFGSGIAEQ